MTVSNNATFVEYNASGTGPYAIPFAFITNAVKVQKVSSLGVVSIPVFTIENNEVTLASALVTGEKLRIYRETDLSQNTSFSDFNSFPAKDAEKQFDKIAMQVQEHARDLVRALKLPFGSVDGQLDQSFEGKLIAIENGQAVPAMASGSTGQDVVDVLGFSLVANFTLPNYDVLRAKTWTNPPKALAIYKPNAIGARAFSGGLFALDEADLVTADDGGTIIVDAVGNRWKRVGMTFIDPRWFGLVGGITDATSIIQAAINAANVWGLPYLHPAFSAIVTQINIPNEMVIMFGGDNSRITQKANFSGDLIVLPSANVTMLSNGGGFDGNQANQSAGAINYIARCPLASDANYYFHRLVIRNHINGIAINGDAVTSSNETILIDGVKFMNGRQSIISDGLRDIVLGNGASIAVRNCRHTMPYVVPGSVTASYGRNAVFVGALLTAFQGDNDFICENNFAENYGFSGTAALGIWDFYWCGSNIQMHENKSIGSITAPIRGKANCKNAHISRNSLNAPNVISPAIAINGVQDGALKDTIIVSDNYINGFANYTTSGLCYVTGLIAQAAKNVVWKDNIFVGCGGSTLYQADYLDAFKIIGGSSDGSGIILNVATACTGNCELNGGEYKAVSSAWGILAENNGVMTNFNFAVIGANIEHNGASYAIRINADIAKVLGGNITGTGVGGIATRNSNKLSVKDVEMSATKTVGINVGLNNGTYTTGSIDIQGVNAPGATANAFLITGATPSGLVRNEGNSWNYSTSAPTNNNLPIGTIIWNSAPVAAGVPGWAKTGATTYKAMAALAA